MGKEQDVSRRGAKSAKNPLEKTWRLGGFARGLLWLSSYSNYYNVSSGSNPLGPVSGGFNVLRGGGWYDNAYDLRVANHYDATPTTRTIHIGFRCAAPSH